MTEQEVSTAEVGTLARISMGRTLFVVLSCILIVAIADQYTKALVVAQLRYGEIVPVLEGFFNITLTYNRGAAFGMLADLPDQTRVFLLTGITALAVLLVIYFLIVDYYHDIVAQFALGLILGGAAGNIIDRARLGQVVDFLDVYYNSYHWPAFNVADSAICIGVFLLLFRRTASSVLKSSRD